VEFPRSGARGRGGPSRDGGGEGRGGGGRAGGRGPPARRSQYRVVVSGMLTFNLCKAHWGSIVCLT